MGIKEDVLALSRNLHESVGLDPESERRVQYTLHILRGFYKSKENRLSGLSWSAFAHVAAAAEGNIDTNILDPRIADFCTKYKNEIATESKERSENQGERIVAFAQKELEGIDVTRFPNSPLPAKEVLENIIKNKGFSGLSDDQMRLMNNLTKDYDSPDPEIALHALGRLTSMEIDYALGEVATHFDTLIKGELKARTAVQALNLSENNNISTTANSNISDIVYTVKNTQAQREGR